MNTTQHSETASAVFNRGTSVFTNRITKITRTILSMLFLALLSFQTFAQDDTWALLKEESGVKVYYQIAQCDETVDAVTLTVDPAQDHQHLRLKIENSNASTIGIEWDQEIKTSGNEGLIDISVDSGQTVIEECSVAPHVQLTVAANDSYPVSFEDYLELVRITIKP